MSRKFSDFITEEEAAEQTSQKSVTKAEKLKDIITDFVNFDTAQIGNAAAVGDLVSKFRSILKGDDTGAVNFIKKIFPAMTQAASELELLNTQPEESPEEAAGEPVEVAGEPTEEEQAAHEAEENPAEEAAEHAPGGSEEGTEEAEGEVEVSGAPAPGVQAESYMVRIANCYFQD